MEQQRSRRQARDLFVIAAALGAAFCFGRVSGPSGDAGNAWASGPPALGFPVDAGQQRKEMLEELRAIRKLLEDGTQSTR